MRRAVGQRGMERNSPAEALGKHTIPHSGATCFKGVSESSAGLEGYISGSLASPDVSLGVMGSISGSSW